MEKRMFVFIGIVILGAVCVFMYHHFAEPQIMDKGGMEDPDFTGDTGDEQLIKMDGDYSYVDNDALLNRIDGVWISEDEHYSLRLGSDYGITLSQDGEAVLEGTISFTYLQPGADRETELTLEPNILKHKDGTVIGTAASFYFVPAEEGDLLSMEIARGAKKPSEMSSTETEDENSESGIVVFRKSESVQH